MPQRLEDCQEQYEQLFRDCQIVEAGKQQEVDHASVALQATQARYAALAKRAGVPWYLVAVVHQREGSGNFSQSVRDGQRLPAGLSWEDDALAVMQERCGGWNNWSLPGLLYRLEAYNGFGYRQYQVNSPYLWSFATCYTKGKFAADGRFDPDQVDKQPGTAVILHRMAAQGLITIPGAAVSPAAPATVAPGPRPAGDAVPAWLLIARQEIGVHENSAPGQDNPRILEYLESTTYDGRLTDEVPWCSAFVNWCVTKAGLQGTNSASASSWLNWGQKLDQPRLGCITVFNHHVGFYAGAAGDRLLLLGGNQSNAVNTEHKDPGDGPAYRWPAAA